MDQDACASSDAIFTLLKRARRIAVIGAKDVQGQPVNTVGRYLIEQGFEVIPVHPKRKTVWGRPAFARIQDVEEADIVVLFRAPQYCADHAREVLEMKHRPLCFWMQEGIRSAEARSLMEANGIMVVEDKCIMVEHEQMAEREHMGLSGNAGQGAGRTGNE